MIFPSFAAAALISQPMSHPFVPISPAPITITADNVDLEGAGRLEFAPDEKSFHADTPPGGDGVTVTVRLWVNLAGQPVSCDVGKSNLPLVASTGCAQLMKTAKLFLFPGFALPLRRGFIDVEFDFFKDPPNGRTGEHMFAHAYPGYVNTEIHYPPNDTPSDHALHNSEGAFVLPIASDDFPTIALRYGMESHSLALLGIGRDGKVQTCRPVGHSSMPNTAFLDNYTCTIFMRRGHFEFLPAAPSYSGLKYRLQAMSWLIPQ